MLALMREPLRWSLALGGLGLMLLAAPAILAQGEPAATVAAITQPEDGQAEDSHAELEKVESSLSLSKDRVEALRREVEAMQGDRAKQTAELVAAGQRVKLAEIEVAAMEERLNELIISEFEIRGRLDGADADIANVLAALERISRHPPPALIVDPSDALGSARSALLISAILPQLQGKAAGVTTDLTALDAIKREALREEELLKANFATLEEEQLRIATLIAARKTGEERVAADLAAEEEENSELAERAAALKALIGDLEQRVAAVNTPAVPAPAPSATSDAVEVALADPARSTPAVPFPSARGHLSMPASGVSVIDFGSSDGFGGTSQGLSIVTRAEAEVVAPADGFVLYRGPYLNYGQIVIINPGDGYTILLAGLSSVGVETGQFVQRGETVGTMGSRTIGRTVTTSAGVSRPTLYIEMRKNNQPIDPKGWWAAPSNKTQSG